ncbi:MAG: beta-galactosidase [Armatimonadetes bacterium]|nr:beta-galactosidase [Armatimonadota bacterium]
MTPACNRGQRGAKLAEGLAKRVSLLCAIGAAVAASSGTPAKAGPGVREPLFFFVGLQGPGAPEVATALGLNALQVRVPLDPAELGATADEIRAAVQQGLKIVIQLPTTMELEQRINLANREYWDKLEAYLKAVMPRLVAEPGVVAWQTGDYLERAIAYDDASFRSFLLDRYGTLDALNAAWRTQFSDWREVTQAAVTEADQSQPWGIGVASVDLADWKAWQFRAIMERWASLVRHWDRTRPLFTGRLSLYRSIASVPTVYDVIVPAMRPDVLESDLLTGNVHAVDMARRGGRFQVIPSFRLPLPPDPLFAEGRIARWVLEAAGHGACGFALEDWERFTTMLPEGETERKPLNPREVRRRIGVLASQLAPLLSPRIWKLQPRPCYAFLWAPYAGGLEVLKVPAYGYLGGWSLREPTWPIFGFRRGCAFGIADFLTPEDALVVDLDRYGAIFAPHLLSAPPALCQALAAWAMEGGVFVADVGLGMYQSGSWQGLAPPLPELVGFGQMFSGAHVRGDWQVVKATQLLPSLPPQARPLGLAEELRGAAPATDRRPRTIDGWLTYALPPPGVETAAIAHTRPTPDNKGRLVAGVFSHTLGLGGAVFATFALWDRWAPDDPLFEAFHAPLCGRRAKYALVGSFWPSEASLVVAADGPYVVTPFGGQVQLVAYRADDALLAHAYCTTSADLRLPDGRRSGDVQLLAEIPPMSIWPIRKLAISVRPYEASCVSHVDVYGPKAIVLRLYGDRPAATQDRDGLKLRARAPARVRVFVSNGQYNVAPGSRHRVVVKDQRGRTSELVVAADAKGVLDFDAIAFDTTVEITPAETSEARPSNSGAGSNGERGTLQECPAASKARNVRGHGHGRG